MFVSMRVSSSALRRLGAAFIAAFLVFGGSTASAGTPPPGPQGVVNINTATADELMLLPRIGEGKAKRIIEVRAKAPFKTVNELARVKGIGLKTLRLLKPYIRIDGPTTLASEVRDADPDETPTRGDKGERAPAPALPAPAGGK